MRNGRSGREPRLDPALLRQRRSIELAAFTSRFIGALFVCVTFLVLEPGPDVRGMPQVPLAMLDALLFLLTCGLSLLALRRIARPSYRWCSLAQIPADLICVLFLVYLTSADPRSGQVWTLLIIPIFVGAFRDDLRGALINGAAATAGFLAVIRWADPIWVRGVNATQTVITAVALLLCLSLLAGLLARASTQRILEMQQVRAALRYQAFHDPLTGLANRSRLHEYAQEALAARRELAVLALDLDGFKQVNDTLGHAAGDELLKVVSARLLAQAREDDIVARLGGDEFVIVLAGADEGIAAEVARRCVAAVAAPIQLNGTTVHVGTSIGFATTTDRDGTAGVPGTSSFGRRDFDGVLRAADAHMYVVKANRRQDAPGTQQADGPGRHRAAPPARTRS